MALGWKAAPLRAAAGGRPPRAGCGGASSAAPAGAARAAGGRAPSALLAALWSAGRALGSRARSSGAVASTSVLWVLGSPRAAFMERLSPGHVMSSCAGESALPTGGLAPRSQASGSPGFSRTLRGSAGALLGAGAPSSPREQWAGVGEILPPWPHREGRV